MTPSMKFFAIAAIPCIAFTGTAVAGSYGTKQDLVDTAVAAGSFDTLVAAANSVRVVDTLKGAGPFAVFTPTDDAFENATCR